MRSQLAETSGARWTLGIAAAAIVTVLGALMATVGGKADISQIAALREQVEENSRRINSTEIAIGRVETKIEFLIKQGDENRILLLEIRDGSKD